MARRRRYTKLSFYRVPSFYFFSGMCFVLCGCSFLFVFFAFFSFLFVVMLRWRFVHVPLIYSCRADHVSDWQPRILLGKVEAQSVNVINTLTRTP